MVSQLKVNEIIKQSGSSITIGVDGDTVSGPFTNTPAFSVVLSSDQSLTSGTNTLNTFDTEEFDTDSAFDNTSGNYKFTVPSGKAGKYMFNVIADLQGSGVSSLQIARIQIYKNGSEYHQAQWHFQDNNPNEVCPQVSIIINLSASDYIQVYSRVNTTSGGNIRAEENGAKTTRFSGYRIIGA